MRERFGTFFALGFGFGKGSLLLVELQAGAEFGVELLAVLCRHLFVLSEEGDGALLPKLGFFEFAIAGQGRGHGIDHLVGLLFLLGDFGDELQGSAGEFHGHLAIVHVFIRAGGEEPGEVV